MVAIEPVPPDIVGCRKIDFHLRNAGADHRDHGHTCSDRFMCIEQLFLYETTEWSIQPSIFQLVFMMLIFCSDLFQAVHGFIVGIRRGPVFFIKSHDTFGFRLDLLVFGLRSIQLHPIICRIQFGQQLSFSHAGAVFHIYFTDCPAHTESQADILRSFHFSWELEGSLTAGGNDRIDLDCLSILCPLLRTGTRHK